MQRTCNRRFDAREPAFAARTHVGAGMSSPDTSFGGHDAHSLDVEHRNSLGSITMVFRPASLDCGLRIYGTWLRKTCSGAAGFHSDSARSGYPDARSAWPGDD